MNWQFQGSVQITTESLRCFKYIQMSLQSNYNDFFVGCLTPFEGFDFDFR